MVGLQVADVVLHLVHAALQAEGALNDAVVPADLFLQALQAEGGDLGGGHHTREAAH